MVKRENGKNQEQNQQYKAQQCALADILHSASVLQQIQAGSTNWHVKANPVALEQES